MSELVATRMTADRFADFAGWDDYELIDGELAPYHRGALASSINVNLTAALVSWCRPRGFARVFGARTTYCCFPDHPDTVRRLWASLVRTDRLTRDRVPSVGHLTLPPDVAADVMTPLHSYEEVEAKVADYRSAGVVLIWVVSPKSRTVLIRRLDGTSAEVNESGELSGEDVVPGFACKVADLFA